MLHRHVYSAVLSCLFAAISPAQSELYRSITIGGDIYVAGPSVKLGQFLSRVKYCPNGSSVLFVEETGEDTYQSERSKIAGGASNNRRYVGRFDIKAGIRTIIYEVEKNEVVMDIEPVGPNGGVICSVVTGKSGGDNLIWKAVYCPYGKSPRVVQDKIVARSLSVAASPTDEKAFIFSCGIGCPTTVSFLTQSGQKSTTLDQEAFQGGAWGSRTTDGDPILTLQGPQPDYKLLGNFKLSFATGTVIPVAELPPMQQEGSEVKPKFIFTDVLRSKGDSQLAQNPLIDIVAESTLPSRGKIVMTQGALALTLAEPQGRSVIYLSNEGGFYLREIVALLKRN